MVKVAGLMQQGSSLLNQCKTPGDWQMLLPIAQHDQPIFIDVMDAARKGEVCSTILAMVYLGALAVMAQKLHVQELKQVRCNTNTVCVHGFWHLFVGSKWPREKVSKDV